MNTPDTSGDTIGQWTEAWAKQNSQVCWFEAQATSTNAIAKDECGRLPEAIRRKMILYATDHQTAGRGRGENTWTDTGAGRSLLSSWSFFLEKAPQPILAPLVGLALFKAALAAWPGLPWALKAPNDLYLGRQKVAGILIENVQLGGEHRAIIGIGFNILNAPESVPTATALAAHLPTGATITRQAWGSFLDLLVKNLGEAIEKGVREQLAQDDRDALLVALNRNPALSEMITHVDGLGQLHTRSGVRKWFEI